MPPSRRYQHRRSTRAPGARWGVAFVAFAVAALSACGSSGGRSGADARNGVIVAGSTSMLPFAERWAEEYHDGRVTVQAGGSTAGIKAVHDGTSGIGMSSRQLHADEAVGLVQTVVARDGIAVIVHATNRVRALTLTQLRAVYAGEITNWQALGGDDASITVITREEGSGTRDTFQELVMAKTAITPGALVTAYSGGLRKMVAEDPHAIGYITYSQLDARIHAVALDGVLPTEHTIANGAYHLQRPFLFLTRGTPSGAAAGFVRFVLSPAGQAIARAEGLAPVSVQ